MASLLRKKTKKNLSSPILAAAIQTALDGTSLNKSSKPFELTSLKEPTLYAELTKSIFDSFYWYAGFFLFWAFLLGYFGFSWLWIPWVFFPLVAIEGTHRRRYARKYALREEVRLAKFHAMVGKTESVHWINSIVDTIFKNYRNVINLLVMETAAPVLRSQKPPQVSALTLDFDVGTIPPELSNFKIERSPDGKKISLDLDLLMSGDMDIVVTAKVALVTVPLAVRDFHIKGTLRVELNLIQEYPFISTASLCFLTNPELDMVIKPLKSVDIMEIPGLSGWLKGTVSYYLGEAMVYPLKMEFNVQEMMGPVLPPEPREVKVMLYEGTSLEAKDSGGTSDPYCFISLFSDAAHKKKSSVQKKTLHPKWNEEFMFKTQDKRKDKIIINLFDDDKFGTDEKLGDIEIPLKDLSDNVPNLKWYDLKNSKSGKLYIGVQVKGGEESDQLKSILSIPQVGVLEVRLIEAKDLVDNTKLLGSNDPYCVLHLGRVSKTSTTKQKTSNPVWEETFHFPVQRIHNEQLYLQVFDKQTVGKNRSLGDYKLKLEDLLGERNVNVGKLQDLWFDLNNTGKGKLHLEIRLSADSIALSAVAMSASTSQALGNHSIQSVSNVVEKATPKLAEGELADGPGLLQINLVQATGLPAMDSNGLSDPYVVLQIDKKIFKSKVIEKTLNPVWNQSFEFVVTDAKTEKLVLKVYDQDKMTKDDKIGSPLTLELGNIPAGKLNNFWLDVPDTPNGKLQLQIAFVSGSEN